MFIIHVISDNLSGGTTNQAGHFRFVHRSSSCYFNNHSSEHIHVTTYFEGNLTITQILIRKHLIIYMIPSPGVAG